MSRGSMLAILAIAAACDPSVGVHAEERHAEKALEEARSELRAVKKELEMEKKRHNLSSMTASATTTSHEPTGACPLAEFEEMRFHWTGVGSMTFIEVGARIASRTASTRVSTDFCRPAHCGYSIEQIAERCNEEPMVCLASVRIETSLTGLL